MPTILPKLRRLFTSVDRWLYLNEVRSSANLDLPDFLGIGPGQSGSTWLFDHLSRHPDIYIPPNKELNYFDRNLHRYSLAKYATHFRPAANRISGEISPGYSILRGDRIQLLRKVMPEVRLILTVRNPIDRSWSAARRLMNRFNFNLEDLDDTQVTEYFKSEWAYQLRGEKGITGDYQPGLLEGQYSKVIEHWLRSFPEEQLLVVSFKQLVEEPQTYLESVCSHIGASTGFDWGIRKLDVKINPNPARELPARYRIILERLYQDEIAWLKQSFGESII